MSSSTVLAVRLLAVVFLVGEGPCGAPDGLDPAGTVVAHRARVLQRGRTGVGAVPACCAVAWNEGNL